MSNHQNAVDPPKGRRTHQPKKVTASVLASALLVAALAPLAAQPANAALAGVGPVSPDHGFPIWYDDGDVKLELCYTDGCLETLPDPTAAPVQPNFPGEAFWFAAGATVGDIGSYEAALEAAHANEDPIDGDQIGFARLRFRFNGLSPNTDYTITHPYGVDVLRTDAAGIINVTDDAGECQPGACNWAGVGNAFLGNAAGLSAKFLRQENAPAGTLGSIETARRVTGSVFNTNYVSVVGPEGEVGRTELFTVQGDIADPEDGIEVGAPSTPNLVDASDSGSSNTDGITSDTTPVLDGTATAGATVELLVDGASAGTTTATGGAYSFTVAAALADGQHTFQARIADPADTVDGFATSGTIRVTVDTVAPTTTINSPFPSSPSANNRPAFNFSSNEATATFECELAPNNAGFTACASPKTWDAQVNGTHTFSVRATDRAGNLGAAVSRTIVIGTTTTPPPPAGTAEQKDMTGDGNPDLVARDSGGNLYLYPSTAAGGFGTRVLIGTGWGSMNAILQPGDFSGDGRSDIMARDTSGRLWLYTGTGTGRINAGRQIGTGWGGMNALITPGDFNGDNRADLLARSTTGALYLYPGNGASGFGTRTQPGSGWGGFTAILSTGDFSGDGRSDVVARTSAGALFLYQGSGTGTFGASRQIGTGWNGFTITGPGAWGTANATSDLVARDSTGRLYVYNGNGTGGFAGSRAQIGSGWGGFTIAP